MMDPHIEHSKATMDSTYAVRLDYRDGLRVKVQRRNPDGSRETGHASLPLDEGTAKCARCKWTVEAVQAIMLRAAAYALDHDTFVPSLAQGSKVRYVQAYRVEDGADAALAVRTGPCLLATNASEGLERLVPLRSVTGMHATEDMPAWVTMPTDESPLLQ